MLPEHRDVASEELHNAFCNFLTGSDSSIEELREAARKYKEVEDRREVARLNAEPDPANNGEEYARLVAEVRRLIVDYKELNDESADHYTEARYEAHVNACKQVGLSLHAMGGERLMKKTIDVYVPQKDALHKWFYRMFDGIGTWQHVMCVEQLK